MLRYRSGTHEDIRKSINLHEPGRMDEAIDILEDWVKKQPHFARKDFSRDYLEKTLVAAKGLVERAKQRIEKLCTLKTLMPLFFSVSPNVKEEFTKLRNIIPSTFLPTPTEDHYRISLAKVISDDYDSSHLFSYYKCTIMGMEYLKKYDYSSGLVSVLDWREGSIVKLLSQVNIVLLRDFNTILWEGYGVRLKGVYIISQSKMVGGLVSLIKQVISPKLTDRIYVIPDDALYEIISRETLPVEYGGKEKSTQELFDDWIEVLTSSEHVNYFKDMANAATDESYRPTYKFNEDYAGTPGSFRALTVD